MRRRILTLAALLTTHPVLAEPAATEATARAHASARPETTFAAGPGGVAGDTASGIGVSLIATHRLSILELGAELGAQTAFFTSLLSAGAVFGVHVGDRLSLRALGTAGFRSYHGVGSGFLSDDPGVSGTLPYVGGRLLLGYSFAGRASSPHRAFVGLLGGLDRDLERRAESVSYVSEPWLFGGEPSPATATHTLGQVSASAFLLAGVEVDLTPY